MSLRDVAVLAQVVMDSINEGQNPGDLSVLEKYLKGRKKEQLQTMGFTESLIRSFSKKTLPWYLLKRSGLLGLEIFPFAKNKLAQQAMGVLDEMPRWVVR